jgi:hypothetical protein
MQRNANIEQTSEINKDFFVISQRVKQIFAVYCKYAKKSKKSCVFADFMGFFVKMQFPVCPPERTFVLRQNFATRYVSGVCNIINGH